MLQNETSAIMQCGRDITVQEIEEIQETYEP